MLDSLERDRSPQARLKALVRELTDQRELAARYGCPLGSLCSELDKRTDGLDSNCADLLELPIDWAEHQFRLMGRRDARDLAVALIASYQGIALLTNTFRDPELMARESRRTRTLDRLDAVNAPAGCGAKPAPGLSGRTWSANPAVRAERPLGCPQEIVTVEGGDAIPLATTTSVLLPLGVDLGTVNWVEDPVPGATDTELQSCVRAYVTTPVAELVMRIRGKFVLSWTSSP